MSRIQGILLAAGQSRRFGSDKRRQSLTGGPQTLLLASVCNLLQHVETLVVLRPGDTDLAAQVQALGARSLRCEDAERGMGHSLAAGVEASASATGWLVALADMPLIQPPAYAGVLAALRRGASVARPAYGGKPGHPVGFAHHWYRRLVTLSGDEGARNLLREAWAEVECCNVADANILLDIDTPADLADKAKTAPCTLTPL